MPDVIASAVLKGRLQARFGDQVPGCVFYVTRNGEPFADGSFGWARRPGAPDGELPMSIDTLVHTGSVGKFFCAVAILRLIEEWNRILDQPVTMRPGGGIQLPPMPQEEVRLFTTVRRHGAKIDLDTKMYPLIEPILDQDLIAEYRARPTGNTYPGANVREITLRQLLTHTSGLDKKTDNADLGGRIVEEEPGDDGPAWFDVSTAVTALLRKDATLNLGYNNLAYAVLGAIIEATTGRGYTDWVSQRLFGDPRFDDLTRKIMDPARAARYYARQGPSSFAVGNHHPDYRKYAAAGGWYVSATQFCDWIDAVMQKTPVGGRPILEEPETLLTAMLGLDKGYRLGRLRGATKNGGAAPGGGHTNARFAFLRGYGEERICAFVEANADIDADPLLDEGLEAVRTLLARRPGPIPAPNPASATGLLQAVYWDDAGALRSASQVADVRIRNVTIGNAAANRTDLFGAGTLAGGRARNDLGMVELRGMLRVTEAGAYRFRLSSDDGSLLWLDDELIIDNDGDHALLSVESEDVHLAADGFYPVRVYWYNGLFGGSLYLEWRTPAGAGYEPIPADRFTPAG